MQLGISRLTVNKTRIHAQKNVRHRHICLASCTNILKSLFRWDQDFQSRHFLSYKPGMLTLLCWELKGSGSSTYSSSDDALSNLWATVFLFPVSNFHTRGMKMSGSIEFAFAPCVFVDLFCLKRPVCFFPRSYKISQLTKGVQDEARVHTKSFFVSMVWKRSAFLFAFFSFYVYFQKYS